jgi:microcystin-dependent protein
MSKKIEILENTLLKLLVRRGSDADRQNVVLTEGELGYTTDTKRLYIGDSQTPGGNITGNIYSGSTSNITSLVESAIGDFGFDVSANKLFILDGQGRPEIFGDWREVGGVYSAGDSSINISADNTITIGTLSAGMISSNLLGNSIVLDNQNRISLNGTQISTDSIVTREQSQLTLPQALRINGINYNWPGGGTAANTFLGTDALGNLAWSVPTSPVNMFVSGEISRLPVGTVISYASSTSIPQGWLLCNGQSVLGSQYPFLSAVIGTTYGGNSTNFNIPNLINKTLYGVSSDPGSSQLFKNNTDTTTATLSSQGTVFIIKAIPDSIVNTNITVTDGITALRDNITVVSEFNPLSGNYTVGIDADFITDIINTSSTSLTGGIIIPSGLVMFDQSGDIKKTNSVINVSLSSQAYFESLIGLSYSGLAPKNVSFPDRNSYRNGAGLAGVYIVDFSGPVVDHLNSVVQIQANNYRGTFTNQNKRMHDFAPIIDYVWATDSRLVFGVATIVYGNPNSDAKGELKQIWLDSGIVRPTTRFSVVVY